MIKKLIRRSLANLGYEIGRLGSQDRPRDAKDVTDLNRKIASLQKELSWSETLRRIHQRDAIEIESLIRYTVLPNLPVRQGREIQLSDLIGTNICEGLYVVAALHEALEIDGDICEFGVAQGATSALIAAEIRSTYRQFYLFDSFEGLPAPTEKDKLIDDVFNLGTMAAYEGTMASPETEVLERLEKVNFPSERIQIRKGWVDKTLARPDVPQKVAFAYVDFDFYEPIKVALAWLDDRTDPGARIVVDDYGFFSEGAQLATDEFIASTEGRWSLHKPLSFAGHFVVLRKGH